MAGNTINPSLLTNMANPTDSNQMPDPSQVDVNGMADLTSAEFDLDLLNSDFLGLDQNNGFDNSFLDGPAAMPTPVFDDPFSRAPQEMVPMPQSFNPSPATLTPTQAFPAVPPGYAYHPQVGWHIPVAMSPQLAAPIPFGMAPPFVAPVAPMVAPMSRPQVPLFDAAPAVAPAKKSPVKRTTQGTKRKFTPTGPQSYFEDKRRAVGDDTPVAVKKPTTFKARPVGAMRDLNKARVQNCRCKSANEVKQNHIPRPRNAFFIFRHDFMARHPTPKGKKRGNEMQAISKSAGDTWQDIKVNDPATEAVYVQRAKEEAAEHKRLYPNYNYDPHQKNVAKFGNPDCTCGAYELNVAQFQHLFGRAPSTFEGDDNDDEDDHVASRTRSRTNSQQVQTAQFEIPNFDADMFEFDFSTDFQNDASNLQWDFTPAPGLADNDGEEPPAKRRSTRNSKKSVSYAEDAKWDENETEGVSSAKPIKHRPAPISTSRKVSTTSTLTPLTDGSVATRTRSKSTSTDGSSRLGSLFSDGDAEENEGDNITVAMPRSAKASPKGVSPALPPVAARQTRSQSRGRLRRRS